MVARPPVVLESISWPGVYRVQPGLTGGTGAICTRICTAENVRCRLHVPDPARLIPGSVLSEFTGRYAPSTQPGQFDICICCGMMSRTLWISSFLIVSAGLPAFQSLSNRDTVNVAASPSGRGNRATCSEVRQGLRSTAYISVLRGSLEFQLASPDLPRLGVELRILIPQTLANTDVIPSIEKLLTPHDIAQYFDVTVPWVLDHVTRVEPIVPHIRMGKKIRFRRTDVMEWLSSKTNTKPTWDVTEDDDAEN